MPALRHRREDIDTLPRLLAILKAAPHRFILFCDDLSFDHDDTSYKSLKAALEGGVEGRPANVIFYATSNRRHLLPRDMIDNERSTAINPGEAVEEKVSLSDRFGLWLGFHACDQDTYFAMIEGYVAFFGLTIDRETLHASGDLCQKTAVDDDIGYHGGHCGRIHPGGRVEFGWRA